MEPGTILIVLSTAAASFLILTYANRLRSEFKGPSTDLNDVHFLLFTRGNPDQAKQIFYNVSESIYSSKFKLDKPTKIVVHGFADNGQTDWILRVKDEYLTKEDCNVISVDWAKMAGPAPFYLEAVENAKRVGKYVGSFLNFIMDSVDYPLDSFHVIGFSLGAQLVSFIGHRAKGKLRRITGLDPAGFMFHAADEDHKLSKKSAEFVDVIHTAGLWIGTDDQVGHVDFYPNSGKAPQPGCDHETFDLECSHLRATELYAKSIEIQRGFRAIKCESWQLFQTGVCNNSRVFNVLGEAADPAFPGTFYLRT